jgi:hypothetical protein
MCTFHGTDCPEYYYTDARLLCVGTESMQTRARRGAQYIVFYVYIVSLLLALMALCVCFVCAAI